MRSLTILDDIRIASPCEADWTQMVGDDRSRFCQDCSKHVYNIAAMTAEEATALILESEGRLCLQVYRRRDGTVITDDCPVGARAVFGRRLRRALAVGMIVPAMVVAGLASAGVGRRRCLPFPTGPSVTWSDRVNWALITLGLRQQAMRGGAFGDIVCTMQPPVRWSDLSDSERALWRRLDAAGMARPLLDEANDHRTPEQEDLMPTLDPIPRDGDGGSNLGGP